MSKSNEWDVEKLKQDIKKYTEMRDRLLSTVKKMEEAKDSADETLKNIPNEDNIWKDRCLKQQVENQKMQEDLEEHQRDLKKLRSRSSGTVIPGQVSEATSCLDKMPDLALRQLQKKLEKDKTELEWRLKEYGWRLDQASAALCRAEEEKEAIMTQIGQAVVKLKDIQKTNGDTGTIAKSFSAF